MNVFISHAQADRDLAEVAADVLTEAGLDVWWKRMSKAPCRVLPNPPRSAVGLSPGTAR